MTIVSGFIYLSANKRTIPEAHSARYTFVLYYEAEWAPNRDCRWNRPRVVYGTMLCKMLPLDCIYVFIIGTSFIFGSKSGIKLLNTKIYNYNYNYN